jgi:hypothetical protein
MRDDLENRSLTGAGNRSGMGTGAIAAIIAAIIVVGLLALWHPWTSRETAGISTGQTVGSSSTPNNPARTATTPGTPGGPTTGAAK